MTEVISTIIIAASLLIGSGSQDKQSADASQPTSGQIIVTDESGM